MEPADYLAAVRTDVERIAGATSDQLDLPVATCPGWSVADLLDHLAGVHCFATAQLGAEPGSEMVPFDPPPAELDPIQRFQMCAGGILDALATTDPSEHRPNWAGAPTAMFWWRRMAHEIAVHRIDYQQAVADAGGAPVDPVDRDLALDGIEELIALRLEGPAITGDGTTVHLHATDLPDGAGGGEWMFTFTPEGVAVERTHGKGDMAVRGPAGELFRFVWNRGPVQVDAFGDEDPHAWWPTKVRV